VKIIRNHIKIGVLNCGTVMDSGELDPCFWDDGGWILDTARLGLGINTEQPGSRIKNLYLSTHKVK
jgi:hypothetical protein